MSLRLWLLIASDIERPVGGLKQIYRLAESIARQDVFVSVVQGTKDFLPPWFSLSTSINTISLAEFKSISFDISRDVLLLPETFIPHFFKLPDLPKIIFNQNAGYTFGERLNIHTSFASKVYKHSSLVSILTVSNDDASFLSRAFNIDSSLITRLVNPIESDLFSMPVNKKRMISYMPRKNSPHSQIISSLLQMQSWFISQGWTLSPIENSTLADVSVILKESFIFMSFGYPEGFGLPIAEALASGCHVVGYHGNGGREIFDLVHQLGTAFPVDYLDFDSYLRNICYLANNFDYFSTTTGLDLLAQSSKSILERYSFDNFDTSVSRFLDKLAVRLAH